MTKKVNFRVVFLSLGILLIVSASYGQATQINGAASGNWSNTASWSPATVPNNGGGNTYDVTLLSSPAVNITLDISPTIDTLTLDSGSVLSTDASTTLTTTGVTNGGTIEFNNGNTLTVNGSMTTSNYLDLDKGSKLVVTGNLTNSGQMYTNIQNDVTAANTITVDGTFTNNLGATAHIGYFGDTSDVMNVGTLSNSGFLEVDTGATLNLTNQVNGVTDVVSGSELDVYGTLKAGSANGLAKLGSVEGSLYIANGQTFTDTPGSGTLTNSGTLDLELDSNVTVSGNLTNSGALYTNVRNQEVSGHPNTLTVTGTFTNNSGATTHIGYFGDTTDVMNVPTLVNNGFLEVDNGATLNLTSQPNGVTDVVTGSELDVYGTLKAGSANGLAKLGSVEGTLVVANGQTFTDTPGSGTLTNSGTLDLELDSNVTVSGNLTNSGALYTNIRNQEVSGHPNTLTVTGTFTNNSGATTHIGYFGDTTDVMNVPTLVNNGFLEVDNGATLNLTSQPNGVTDVVTGSELDVYGTLKAGSANGLAKLGSVEGTLVVANGQTFTDTPGSGTLTNSGTLDLELDSNVTVSGNLTNSGALYTNIRNQEVSGHPNTLTVTGTFTNNSGATTHIGYFGDTTDVMNVPTLVNNGFLEVDNGATLNLTSQPNGVTDVVSGSQLNVYGTLKAGTANGLAKLSSVEGSLTVGNGQTFTDTPGTGTLTISSTGRLDLESSTNMTVSGNLTNSGGLFTNAGADGGANTLTVTGTFTNNSGANTQLGVYTNSTDVMNVATLVNSGSLTIGTSATLNLTSQPNGITDIVAGSNLAVNGTLKAGTANGLAKLGSVEGSLTVANGQTFTDTPGGTLTISSTGHLDLDASTNMTVSGNLTNSGGLFTNAGADGGANTLTVTGTFTNNSGANTQLGVYTNSTDVMNVATLVNSGNLTIGTSATLNLTNAGTATNTGTINVGSNAGGGAFKISGNTTLTGTTGKVILSDFAGNIIGGTGTLTNVKNTIEGSGNIGNGTMGLNNQGTIDANQSVPLIIQAAGTASNSLTEEATNGATLQLEAGNYTQTSAGNILASETGNALSTVNLESGVSITGGKLTTTGTTATIDLVGASATLTLSGVSISGTGSLQLADGSTTTLLGPISNTGTVDVNSTGDTTTLKIGVSSVTLSGTGKIILASNGKGVITGASSSDTLHNGNTIEGPGNIGDGVIGLVNTGTIETVAHQTGNTEIDAGTNGFNNQGTVEAVAGTTLYIDNASNQFLNFNSGTSTLTGGTYVVDGILEFDGASITTDAANITLSGASAKIENSVGSTNALMNLNTIASGGTFDIITQTFTTTGNFTVDGTLDVGASSKFVVLAADTLTNFSGTTLTGGAYNVTGTLEFAGANIVNNDASITLTGTKALIENSTNSANALAGFANNEAGATFALATAAKFTTAGNFTNSGTLNVGTGSLFAVGAAGASDLTNFSSATSTLTGGTYIATGTGQIQFNNGGGAASIVTNAANIILSGSGSTASFIDQTSANMLASFATNASTGSFTLESDRSFTTVGAFSNAGALLINKGSTFTVGANGNYTMSGGSTTVNGTLTVGSSAIVDVTGGSLFGDAGTINGNVDLTGGNANPGDALNAIGDYKINGTYTQGSSADLNIDIAGTAPNTLYSVLNIVDAATLGGTLNVNLENGYIPKVNTKFTILNYGSFTGAFATINLPTVTGDHWSFTCGTKSCVLELLAGTGPNMISDTLSSGPAASSASLTTMHGAPAARVSTFAGAAASASSTHAPVAILSRVTCFAARLLGSASCGAESPAIGTGRGGMHAVASTGASSREVHNNIMVATRTISAAPAGPSHESSASATAMARLYVCAYLPSTVARTMGCN